MRVMVIVKATKESEAENHPLDMDGARLRRVADGRRPRQGRGREGATADSGRRREVRADVVGYRLLSTVRAVPEKMCPFSASGMGIASIEVTDFSIEPSRCG